ncbi:hypothetical protein WS71_09150 [Burkholderia mayonis]|uniref:Uncharacterized protein n=1 Tax=Burkholderia mayonis TaxID=1385591 RepID=A0A1B4FUU6_9BURK|nr:hypothetical protein WS71_09150 [Burkholderia mayonis]
MRTEGRVRAATAAGTKRAMRGRRATDVPRRAGMLGFDIDERRAPHAGGIRFATAARAVRL